MFDLPDYREMYKRSAERTKYDDYEMYESLTIVAQVTEYLTGKYS